MSVVDVLCIYTKFAKRICNKPPPSPPPPLNNAKMKGKNVEQRIEKFLFIKFIRIRHYCSINTSTAYPRYICHILFASEIINTIFAREIEIKIME